MTAQEELTIHYIRCSIERFKDILDTQNGDDEYYYRRLEEEEKRLASLERKSQKISLDR